jgi:hypothetical protein
MAEDDEPTKSSMTTAQLEIQEYETSIAAIKNFNESLRHLSDRMEEMTESVEQTNKLTSGWLNLWFK